MSEAGPFRLPSGGLIDRAQHHAFRFDGVPMQGFAGDTLASALLANGVRLVGRSFKYHRPRGILSAGSEEPNALVELRRDARREPNSRATTIELFDGLEAASQNRWPSLRLDLMALNGLIAPLLSAGFYYKTFMWPRHFWEALYEPLIRRAAGLGRAADAPDPDPYEKAFAHCDLLVVGAGPAGLAAALAAGRAGARVILCDEDARPGGRLLADARRIGDAPASDWLAETLAELATLPHVRLMPRSTVYGVFDGSTHGVIERVADHLAEPPPFQPRQRAWRIVARKTILATGGIERPITFAGNDLPGVMLAGAVRTYLNRFGVLAGCAIIVFTTGDDGWTTAQDIVARGGRVTAIIDPRTTLDPALPAMAARLGVPVLQGVVRAARGGRAIRTIEVLGHDGRLHEFACDCLAVSNGWNPSVHLACHLDGKPVWDADASAFVMETLPEGMRLAGTAAGRFSLADALADGARLGAEAAGDCGFRASLSPPTPKTDDEPVSVSPIWHVAGGRGKAFVDLQNDVTVGDVAQAAREGYAAVEHMKRYTTLGMATDQGKTANLAGLAILGAETGRSIAETGTTTFRPPFVPVAIGALAGLHRGKAFRPTRASPTHRWSAEQGAVFIESGPWLRAQYYPRPGETDWLETVNREVNAVRHSVGICDVSTLGKIELKGPDAGRFLDFVYANAVASLPIGKARYGLMLREDGFVFDDGTTARLGPDHYVMTTTTANAARVMQHLDFCQQVLCPALDLRFVSVSEHWAQVAIAGPKARAVLERLLAPDYDLSDAAFPYLAAGRVHLRDGLAARLFRLSFSGERAYELAVPAGYGDAVMAALMAAGAEFGITPYGIEALGVMRIEKGHVAGNELNGQTTARDLGLGRMLSKKKDFIGRVLAGRPALVAADRPSLAGFRPVEPGRRLRAGAHFIPLGATPVLAHDEGYMTSVAHSPSLGHWLGLGLVRGGAARAGERVMAVDPLRDEAYEVEITAPCQFDPTGERLHG